MRLYRDRPSGTVARARELRRNASEPERRLLRGLREAFPDLKWRHQAPIGPFHADILCFDQKLVIEVDGDTHTGAEIYDANRTRFLQSEGYRVIRFTNTDVMQNLDGVLTSISLSLSLSLREREGAAQPRKGEGDARSKGEPAEANSPSPSHASRGPLPLPKGEEL